MCGITGFVNWKEDLRLHDHILENMVKTLTPRGPDSQGKYISNHAAFGHTRLIVLDPSGGAQPMIRYRNGEKFVITYNGRLYNAADLRRRLGERGCKFTSASDTEVLLTAYIEWGQDFIHRLNGIYAFAIWNENKETLFMARDRAGAKPLFYAERETNLIFGSELKALLAHPAVRPQIDAEGLAEVFMLGPARTPGHGVFRGVYELKPGHSLFSDGRKITINKYWSLISEIHNDDFQTTASTVRELLKDALKRQLISDVPICTLLSGGLDSSILTALTAGIYKEIGLGRLNTYSVDYVDNEKHFTANSFQPNSDEPWARLVSAKLDTNHHTILIDTPELSDIMANATLARDLPGMADTDSSLYIFCREIKRGATVAITGEGADEVFGGYPWFHRQEMLSAAAFPWAMRPEARLDWLSEEIKEKINPLEYVDWRYREALAETPRLPGEDPAAARMREISYLSLTRFMPTLLDRKDRMSMANGLEARMPYSDHRLVEYVWNIPWSMKYHAQREKGLLRQAFTDLLPEDILWRKKSPYPKTHNPEFANNVVKKALTVFADPSSPLLPLINMQKLKEIAATNLSATSIPWFGQLMGAPQLFAYLVQMDIWLREYKVEIV